MIKYTSQSINEIRENTLNNKPIIIYNYSKDFGQLEGLYQLLKELENKGATLDIEQNLLDEMIRKIDM